MTIKIDSLLDFNEYLSKETGRDFTQFVHKDEDGNIYVEFPEGALNPEKFKLLPIYG